MKPVSVIILILFITTLCINPAIAGGKYGGHYRGYGHHGHSRHYGYRRHYGHRGHYGHYGSHGHNAAYAIGGLIFGTILGATLADSYHRDSYRSYAPQYTNPYPANTAVKPSYVMQPNGICYIVSHVSNGNLVLSPTNLDNCR